MRILHAAYDPHTVYDLHAYSACSLMFRMRPYSLVCSLPNDLCGYGTKGVDACGCIGSAFNEVQWSPPTQPSLATWRVMIADFQH